MGNRSWILVAVALVLLPGCDCGSRVRGDDDAAPECSTDDECPRGQRCAADQTCRGDDDCSGNETTCGSACCAPTELCIADICVDCPTLTCGEQCCAEGEGCTNDGCCPEHRACEFTCCAADQTCLAGECQDDCGELARCGDPGAEVCCAPSEVCYLGACREPGAPCANDQACPEGEYCEPTLERCLPRGNVDPDCQYQPPIGDFDPIVEWAWDGTNSASPDSNQVMVPPMVADLDGALDGVATPEIVFSSFASSNYGGHGVLRALRGDTGDEYWSVTDARYTTSGGATVAIGDIDSDGSVDIVTCAGDNDWSENQIIAFEADGSFKWKTNDARVHCGWSGLVIANLDGVGNPEIIARYTVVDSSGEVVWSGRTSSGVWMPDDYPTVEDIDGDGSADLIGGNIVYDADGGVVWDISNQGYGDGYPAVADVDGNGTPDVVVVSSGEVRAHEGLDGALLWRTAVGAGRMSVIANFDDEDLPEVGVPNTNLYHSIEGDTGAVNWTQSIQDASGLAGSSVFDFDGDGSAEVVYADETRLRTFRGSDGEVLFDRCNTSGTLWEYPVIADVDADDHAEIVVAANNVFTGNCADGSAGPHGIQVFGERNDNWVRTRSIWNQHAYHVTNVDDDGSIPDHMEHNWEITGLNNFRQQTQVTGILDAGDLEATDLSMQGDRCPATARLWARVWNTGAAGVGAGMLVAFYRGAPGEGGALLGTTTTTHRLLPGESELVYVDWNLPPEAQIAPFTWHVVVAPGPDAAASTSATKTTTSPGRWRRAVRGSDRRG